MFVKNRFNKLSAGARRKWMLWHRRIGVGLCIFIVWLAVSGVFINHADDWQLDKTYVSQQWLLSVYGVESITPPLAYSINNRWLHVLDERIYIDSSAVGECVGSLVSVVPAAFGFVVICTHSAWLLSTNLLPIEMLRWSWAGGVSSVYSNISNDIVLINSSEAYQVEGDWLDFSLVEFDRSSVAYSLSKMNLEPLPQELLNDLMEQGLGHSITWERVLLDLHAGRFAGRFYVWLWDLVAIFMIVVATTGVFVWWSRRTK